jgi:hypothetical protein
MKVALPHDSQPGKERGDEGCPSVCTTLNLEKSEVMKVVLPSERDAQPVVGA